MSAQVYSVPGQTEGRRKAFLEWKSIDLSYELPLTCGGIISIIKMFIILRNICIDHGRKLPKLDRFLGNFLTP